MAKKQEEIQIDGFYVREALIKAPAGAPFGDVRLVVRRATQGDNRRISETAARLFRYMAEKGQYGVRLENEAVVADRAVKAAVQNFVMCAVQIVALEGMPGLDAEVWKSLDAGAGNQRLLETFDAWQDLDAGLVQACCNAVFEADQVPTLVMDPNLGEASATG
jgi:hypothetical protein